MNRKNKLSSITLIFLICLGIFAAINPTFVKASTNPIQISVSSASASSYNGANTPSQAINGMGSTSNYWGTNALITAGQIPQWLQLQLATQTSINQVVTHFWDGDSRTYTYYIQTSTDGSTWTTVVSTKTGSGTVTDTFTTITANYVRITVTGNTANKAAHIEQIKIYQSSSQPTQNQISVYSASASSYNGANTPSQAINGMGSTSNYWGTNALITAGQIPQWLQLQLATQTSINQVVTHFWDGDSRTYTYYIQTSTDGSTWTTVVSTKTGSGTVTDTFTTITANYVRITVTGNTANKAAHIEQIKIYQTTGSTTPPSIKYMGAMNPDWVLFSASDAASMAASGANTLKSFLYLDWWSSNIVSHKDGTTKYQAKNAQMVQWAHANGMKFWMECFSSNWNPSEGWDQMKANVILNYNGMGDQWINGFGQIIQTLHPDVVDVMNEPPYFATATNYANQYTNAQFFQAYEQFVIRAIDAWRTIDPNLVISVAPMPFWDFSSMAANPIPRSNIIYDYHYSYCGDNIAPPSSSQDQYAYWTGQLSTAKSALYTNFLSWSGIQLMLNKGLTVEFGETGTNLANPNAQQFMQDVYDFGRTYNIGVIQDIYRAYNPSSTGGMGLLNSDCHTLNGMGQLWATNMVRG